MTTFTYKDYEFEARQNEVNNIVWLAGNPDMSWSLPKSFTFKQVAEALLDNWNLPY